MFNYLSRYRFFLAFLLLLPSCASSWSEAQKEELTSLTARVEFDANQAYQEPLANAPDSGVGLVTMPLPGTSLVEGAIIGVLGQLAKEADAAGARKELTTKYAGAIAKAPRSIPADFGKQIERRVAQRLANNSFYKGRYRSNSQNQFRTTVDKVGYVRVPKVLKGELLLTPTISGTHSFNIGSSQVVESRSFSFTASDSAQTLPYFIENPAYTRQVFASLADQVAMQIEGILNIGVGLEGAAEAIPFPTASPIINSQPTSKSRLNEVSGGGSATNQQPAAEAFAPVEKKDARHTVVIDTTPLNCFSRLFRVTTTIPFS